MDFNDAQRRFHQDPSRNPETGAKIQVGKGTYLVLIKKYGPPPGGQVSPNQGSLAPAAFPGFLPGLPSPGFPPSGAFYGALPPAAGSFAPAQTPTFASLPPPTFASLPPPTFASLPPPTFAALPPMAGIFGSLPTPAKTATLSAPAQGFLSAPAQGFLSAPAQGFLSAPAQGFLQSAAPAQGFLQSAAPAQGFLQSAAPFGYVSAPVSHPMARERRPELEGALSVLVIYQRPDELEFYIIPKDEDHKDLIEELYAIDGTVQDSPSLNNYQSGIYETLESNLEIFSHDSPIRGFGIVDVIHLNEGVSATGGGDEEDEDEGGAASSDDSGDDTDED